MNFPTGAAAKAYTSYGAEKRLTNVPDCFDDERFDNPEKASTYESLVTLNDIAIIQTGFEKYL
jgi:hypothetical protein